MYSVYGMGECFVGERDACSPETLKFQARQALNWIGSDTSQYLSFPEPCRSRVASPYCHLLHPAESSEAALTGPHLGSCALGLLLGLHNREPSQWGGRGQ